DWWNLSGVAIVVHSGPYVAAARPYRCVARTDHHDASDGSVLVEPRAWHSDQRHHYGRANRIGCFADNSITIAQRRTNPPARLGSGAVADECARVHALVLATRWRRANSSSQGK